MHGKWSLYLAEVRGTAAFSAEMTMETADFANTDPNHDPTKLGTHTHHISVTDGVIHNDPTDPINWKTQCPTFKPAGLRRVRRHRDRLRHWKRGQPAIWQPVAGDDLYPRRDAEPERRGCPGIRRVLKLHVGVRDGVACQHSFRNASDQRSRRQVRTSLRPRVERLQNRDHRLTAGSIRECPADRGASPRSRRPATTRSRSSVLGRLRHVAASIG